MELLKITNPLHHQFICYTFTWRLSYGNAVTRCSRQTFQLRYYPSGMRNREQLFWRLSELQDLCQQSYFFIGVHNTLQKQDILLSQVGKCSFFPPLPWKHEPAHAVTTALQAITNSYRTDLPEM